MNLLPVSALALAVALVPAGSASADDYDYDALRVAAEKYRDVNAALADGFVPDPSGACVSAEAEGLPAELGGMGIHYLHPALLQIATDTPRVDGVGTHTDFMKPAILLYEPQADGTLVLVGIENLVFEAAWRSLGNDGPPVMNGRPWDRMADHQETDLDEAHGFMPHFDQHVWLFRDNPAGMLEPFNPAVSCANHAG